MRERVRLSPFFGDVWPRQDVERLRQELDRYRQEQEQLRQTKARVLVMEERLRDLHWEDEVINIGQESQ